MSIRPTLTVLLDDGTGTFPHDITTFVLGTDGYQITKGRSDWQGAVTAGQLTLTLNNSDGRFSPGSTILGTPSPIVVDQRIRVSESLGFGGWDVGGWDVGGWDSDGAYAQFTGYVKSWPVAWPATVTTYSEVQITATDAQARAERRTLRSMLEEEIQLLSPAALYALGEAAGATSAGDTSGNQCAPLTISGSGTPVAFGTDVGLDSGTAASFGGGEFLVGSPTGGNAYAMVISTVTSTTQGFFGTSGTAGGALWNYSLQVTAAGTVALVANGVTLATGSAVVNDGKEHSVWWGPVDPLILGRNGVWIDGVRDITYGATIFTFAAQNFTLGAGRNGEAGFVGTVTQFVIGALSTTAPVAIAKALTGFAGETATARIERLGSYAGLSLGTIDTSAVVVPAQATSASSAWDAMQAVADAALGLVYVDGSGLLTFHDGTRVPSKTTPDITLIADFATPDVEPMVDDQRLVNYVEATSVATGGVSVAQSSSSQTTHGRYPESNEYLVTTDSQALDRANWIIANFAESTPRYGTLTINLYKMTAAQAQVVLNAFGLDCWLRVTNLASQTPGGTTADVVIQGYQWSSANEAWSVTCNVVERALYNAFIPDDPVYGIPDSAVARVFV